MNSGKRQQNNLKDDNDSRLFTWFTIAGDAVPIVVLFIVAISVPFAVGSRYDLSKSQLSSWILIGWALPAALSLIFIIRYKQPLLLTGNIFTWIFIGSLSQAHSFPEVIGAVIVTGIGMLIIGLLGLTSIVAAIIPYPVVLGLLCGAILPFVSDIFTLVPSTPLVIGAILLSYILSRRFLGNHIPAVLPSLFVGLIIAAVTRQFSLPSEVALFPVLAITKPIFSIDTIITAVPTLLVLVVLQSNVPSTAMLRNQDYQPPERTVNAIGGIATAAGSFLGPIAVSFSLPITSILANAKSHNTRSKQTIAVIGAMSLLMIALFAGFAAEVPSIVPMSVLLTIAGLSMFEIFVRSIRQIVDSPIAIGPLLAFVITLSSIELLGLGNQFWALVVGTAVSYLLEKEGLNRLRDSTISRTKSSTKS